MISEKFDTSTIVESDARVAARLRALFQDACDYAEELRSSRGLIFNIGMSNGADGSSARITMFSVTKEVAKYQEQPKEAQHQH
jgi:hypothetical protein